MQRNLRKDQIQNNINAVQNKIADRAELIAVTKYSALEDLKLAYECGLRNFGENKVQDLEDKSNSLSDLKIHWHFIGHLQSNKVKKLLKIKNLKSIHSVSSLKLAKEILKNENLLESSVDLFIQINTSGEKEKGGFEVDDLEGIKECLQVFQNSKKLNLLGLMTIGKIRTENFEEAAVESFTSLRNLRDQLDSNLKLSMGMSQDFELAIENQANYVRVGSALFK